jgi:hypothetical protein
MALYIMVEKAVWHLKDRSECFDNAPRRDAA